MRITMLALIVALLAGCASGQPRAVRSEFEDIPVPRGLSYLADRSTVIESPSVKAARLLYRGRVEVQSLAGAMRATLEANGWRHVSSTRSSEAGTTQVYEKANNSLQVRLWEGVWYTYVELTGSRALAVAR
jgi:hypothetical protein